jgi:glutamyl/glutaminyl-tRNA synthetase
LEKGLDYLKKAIDAQTPLDEGLKQSIQSSGKDLSIKGKELFFPFRVAITGVESGPELVPLAKLLGPTEVVSRLQSAISVAGAV